MKITIENIQNQSKNFLNEKLFALIAGIRGAGKSTMIGTLNEPTLFIASSLESHGVGAAQIYGGKGITPILYDVDEEGKQMKADAALANLHSILDFLTESSSLQNFKVVALDSISAVDKTLIETNRVLQEKNPFEQMKIMEQEHLRIIRKLKEIHRKGFHIVVTMPILATFDEEGFYVTAKPEIRGTTTTSNIMGNFGTILVVARIAKEYVFQMDLFIKKVGKEVSGTEKQVISSPRVYKLSTEDITSISSGTMLLPADLSYVFQLIDAKVKQNDSK